MSHVIHDAQAGAGLLHFARHGATAPNLAGLRCGGDLDVPLAEAGRQQAHRLAREVAALRPPIGLIVTSPLQRTRETAAIVAAAVPGIEIVIDPGFTERLLGDWNRRPIAETQPWLEAGLCPPGGESDEAFVARIDAALQRLRPLLDRRPLLLGSKGVARVLGQLAGMPRRLSADNAELLTLQPPPALRRATTGEPT